ncbi:uncharacterized protein BXY66_3273 [Shimia isoporae]|uniref:Lysozyme inhibitor LprI N-terminal domain-containing protein n=1 Tax=Shimia isoporae TaxID=647720 RepID=A0A4R1NB27_9RHOB|nr:MliC family protein [Shimia isoporae]TCL00626.1 uncharacterized protein BXY66_3273 [Shimia isoporae]
MRFLSLSVALIVFSTRAFALDPSFDCAKAGSSAEEAVCASDALAALDLELARVYGLAATSDLSSERLNELKATQRGWIKGRDECWKSSLGLEACVGNEYAFRIAELRQGYAGAREGDGPSEGPFPYVCEGMDAPLSVTFINAEPPRAVVGMQDGTRVLVAGPSGSGVRYEGIDMVLHTKGKEAAVEIDGAASQCMQDDIG